VEYLYNQTGEVLSENTLEDEDVQAPGEELLSDLNPDQLDEGFVETEDETIAGAEQVFTVPEGSEKGKGNAYFLIRGIPVVRFQGIPFPASLRGVQTEKNERLPLRRGHANLLCIVPILVYVLPKQYEQFV